MAARKLADAGVPFPELCREHGMSSAATYKWRAEYGGTDASLMARLKELEDKNRRLKKMYADERLKSELRKEAVKQRGIRLACETCAISERCYRYSIKLSVENIRIADRLVRLPQSQHIWGWRLYFLYLRNVKGYC